MDGSIMPVRDAAQLTWSKAWTIDQALTGVELTAGHDLRIAIDGISPTGTAAILEWHATGVVAESSSEAAGLIPQLIDLGVLVPVAEKRTLALPALGGFASDLSRALEQGGWRTGPVGGLALAVRVGPEYPTPIATPHLLVDVALHHTLVLGPLVLPGLTSCIECLRVRVERLWPTGSLPDEPRMQSRPGLVAELVALHAELFFSGSSPLLNATVTWDFETGASTRERLLRVPDCSGCKAAPPSGRLELPWAVAQ